jgi:hypothetical protein
MEYDRPRFSRWVSGKQPAAVDQAHRSTPCATRKQAEGQIKMKTTSPSGRTPVHLELRGPREDEDRLDVEDDEEQRDT